MEETLLSAPLEETLVPAPLDPAPGGEADLPESGGADDQPGPEGAPEGTESDRFEGAGEGMPEVDALNPESLHGWRPTERALWVTPTRTPVAETWHRNFRETFQ